MDRVLFLLIKRLLEVMGIDHVPLKRHGISQLEAYDVTADELDSIERECNDLGLEFQVMLFCITEAISFSITLASTTITSRITADTFIILVVVGFLLGIVYGIKWFRSRQLFGATIRKIRERAVGPVGDVDNPLRPSEVAELVAVQAPSMNQLEVQPIETIEPRQAE